MRWVTEKERLQKRRERKAELSKQSTDELLGRLSISISHRKGRCTVNDGDRYITGRNFREALIMYLLYNEWFDPPGIYRQLEARRASLRISS